jgi:UDP-GlcNAc:undecaprenyl-phosphate GlcNAc-1-phosphate transferase
MWFCVYLFLFVVSLVGSLLVTSQAITWATRWGYLDHPGERKVHDTVKPRLGGLGIFSGFFLALLLAILGGLLFPADWLPQSIGQFLEHHRLGIEKEWKALLGLVVGGVVIFLGGLLDDRYNLKPYTKLAWQIAAALITISAGYRLDFHKVFWHHPLGEYLIAIPFTLFWMLFLMNAFNFLDNMDGLSAGVAGITTLFFSLYAYLQGEYFLTACMVCLIGALLGFLHYNWTPSKIFMGDGGALLVGFLIAAFTCRCTYYRADSVAIASPFLEWLRVWSDGLQPGGIETRQGLLSILTPLVIMAVPIFDTSTVLYIRWRKHQPLMVGDKNHFSHRLVALGLSNKQAVEVIYVVTIFTGLGALILQSASLNQAFLILLQVISVFAMILLLENRQRLNRGDKW